MDKDKVRVVVSQDVDREDLYLKEHEQKLIQALRSKAAREADQKYREQHKDHCFRCGTRSLAEIRHAEVTLDVCINEGCGAVHLDPGELEASQQFFAKTQGGLVKITSTLFSIFK